MLLGPSGFTFLLMNVFTALKESHFRFLFDFTAAGVVPCGGCKTSPRTSTIEQFIATLLDAAKPRPSGALMVTRV